MTKEEFIFEACEAKLTDDEQCGVGDPYPYDVKAAAYIEAARALGATDAEINAAWASSVLAWESA